MQHYPARNQVWVWFTHGIFHNLEPTVEVANLVLFFWSVKRRIVKKNPEQIAVSSETARNKDNDDTTKRQTHFTFSDQSYADMSTQNSDQCNPAVISDISYSRIIFITQQYNSNTPMPTKTTITSKSMPLSTHLQPHLQQIYLQLQYYFLISQHHHLLKYLNFHCLFP